MNTSPPSSDATGLIYMALFMVFCWAIWHFFHGQITNFFRIICYGELWLLSRIVSDPTIPQVRDMMHDTKHYAVDWPYIQYCAHLIGHYLKYPIAGILALLAYYLMAATPKTAFKKAYTLDRLIAAQVKMWPVIAPIVRFNPAQDNSRDPNAEPPDKLPLFAESLSPQEWLKFHHIGHGVNGLDQEAAARAFADQLGPRWRGPNALPFHAKALFAAFALKMARKRDEADTLLGDLALVADPKLNMALRPSAALRRQVDSIISDPKIGGEAAKLAKGHAYVATALLRVLQAGRERGGVLAPAQFLWLRGANRPLWYALNNLGRQSFHTEGAGAIAHYFAEYSAGAALLSPKVAGALASLSAFDHRPGGHLPVVQ
jgi:intracellular multiplication protein IcmP